MKALICLPILWTTQTKRVTICCHNTDLVHVNGHDRIILVIFSQALCKAPWWWILCDPKHVEAPLNILYFYLYLHYILFISWIVKCLIILRRFCKKYESQEENWRPCYRWENNIKTDLKQGDRAWFIFIRFKKENCRELLLTRWWTSVFINGGKLVHQRSQIYPLEKSVSSTVLYICTGWVSR